MPPLANEQSSDNIPTGQLFSLGPVNEFVGFQRQYVPDLACHNTAPLARYQLHDTKRSSRALSQHRTFFDSVADARALPGERGSLLD
jgi:hypothetical protein